MSRSRLHELSDHGVSVWIDSLSREMLETGELARLMEEDAVVGVTSNPTIFQKALSEGDWYDAQLREAVAQTDDTTELFIALAQEDIRDACDLLAPVWERTQGIDGWVSLEVDPTLAYDRDATFAQATRFHAEVARPNLYVKIPGTEPGLGAIEDSIAAARSINVTLIFGLERYAAVVEAYLRGLERLVEAGGDPGSVLSVASFFVSRVDTEADRRLDEVGTARPEGQARGREREARLPSLAGGVLGRPVGGARVGRRAAAALPLGLDLHEEPGLPRRPLRRGARRARRRQHHAARDGSCVPGPRRGP